MMSILILFNIYYNIHFNDFQGLYYKEPGYQNKFIEELEDSCDKTQSCNISCVLFDFPTEDNIQKMTRED